MNCSFNDISLLSLAMCQTLSLRLRTKHTKSLGLRSWSLRSGEDTRREDRPHTVNKMQKLKRHSVPSCGQKRRHSTTGAAAGADRVAGGSPREKAVSEPRLKKTVAEKCLPDLAA